MKMPILVKMKSLFNFFYDWMILLVGLFQYRLFQTNSPHSYQALIRLFCRTQGKSNDLLTNFLSILNPPKKTNFPVNGVLGELTSEKLKKLLNQLETDGFCVMENELPIEVCDAFLNWALTTPGEIRSKKISAVYERNKPLGVRYDFLPQDVVNLEFAQKLMADPSIITLAQAYLKSTPILDVIGFWWHTAFQKEPDADAAQFFHFDMDRVKWLKFFFYITDVTTETGPHCFIRGSQRTGGIPKTILNKGYARLTDEELRKHYLETDFIEFSGKRGTIIAEDTRGLHKGKHVENGDRLIFQLQFSNSLFGGKYDPVKITKPLDPGLKAMCESKSPIFKSFI